MPELEALEDTVQVLEVPEDTVQVLDLPVDMDLEPEAAQEVDLEVQLEELVLTLTSTLEVVPEATGQPLEVPVELEEPEDSCSTVFPSHQVVSTLLSFLPVAALLSLDLLSDPTPTTLQLFLSALEVV